MPTFTPGDTVPPTGLISSSPNINDDSLGTDITPVGWPTTGKATAVEVELGAGVSGGTGMLVDVVIWLWWVAVTSTVAVSILT